MWAAVTTGASRRVVALRGARGYLTYGLTSQRADHPYKDEESDRAFALQREQARQERRAVSRSNLLAQDYAQDIAESSLTLFVHGDASALGVRLPLRDVGFSSRWVKNKLIKVAAGKLDGGSEDAEHMIFAKGISRGQTSMLCYREPLLSLVATPGRLKAVEETLSLHPPKDGVYKNNLVLVAGYIRDKGKASPNIWLTQTGLAALIDSLKEQAGKLPPDSVEGMEPHALFHANLVAGLLGHVGAIRTPLLAPAKAASGAFSKIPRSATNVFSQLKALREQEDKEAK